MKQLHIVSPLKLVKGGVGGVLQGREVGVCCGEIVQIFHAVHLKVDDSRDWCVDRDRALTDCAVAQPWSDTRHDPTRRLRGTLLKHTIQP